MRPRPPPQPRGRISRDDPRLDRPPSLRVWLWVIIGLAIAIAAVALLLMTSGREVAAAEVADLPVYKGPSCSCCTAWVEHLEASGFRVAVREQDDLGPIETALARYSG